MTSRVVAYCLGLYLCIPQPSAAQEDARNIIQKAIQAAGLTLDNKTYHETWREQGKMTAMGMSMPYDSRWMFEAPNKYRFDMKIDFQGQKMDMTFIQNGDKAKESMAGQSRPLEGPKLEETKHSGYQFWVCSLRPLLQDPGFKLQVLPPQNFAGKPVRSIKVMHPGRREITLHFDSQTHLLAGCSDRVKDEFQNWKEVAQDSEFGGYQKSPSGEMIFTKLTVKRDGKPMLESQLSDYRRSDKLTPEAFKVD